LGGDPPPGGLHPPAQPVQPRGVLLLQAPFDRRQRSDPPLQETNGPGQPAPEPSLPGASPFPLSRDHSDPTLTPLRPAGAMAATATCRFSAAWMLRFFL